MLSEEMILITKFGTSPTTTASCFWWIEGRFAQFSPLFTIRTLNFHYTNKYSLITVLLKVNLTFWQGIDNRTGRILLLCHHQIPSWIQEVSTVLSHYSIILFKEYTSYEDWTWRRIHIGTNSILIVQKGLNLVVCVIEFTVSLWVLGLCNNINSYISLENTVAGNFYWFVCPSRTG